MVKAMKMETFSPHTFDFCLVGCLVIHLGCILIGLEKLILLVQRSFSHRRFLRGLEESLKNSETCRLTRESNSLKPSFPLNSPVGLLHFQQSSSSVRSMIWAVDSDLFEICSQNSQVSILQSHCFSSLAHAFSAHAFSAHAFSAHAFSRTLPDSRKMNRINKLSDRIVQKNLGKEMYEKIELYKFLRIPLSL